MLEIDREILCYVAAKAREFQAKEGVVIPDDSPEGSGDDWAMQVLANHQDDMTLQEIYGLIADLGERSRAELVAMLWLGRGDYEAAEFETAVDDAIGDFSVNAAAYLLSHPMVSDYLADGLIALGMSCEE